MSFCECGHPRPIGMRSIVYWCAWTQKAEPVEVDRGLFLLKPGQAWNPGRGGLFWFVLQTKIQHWSRHAVYSTENTYRKDPGYSRCDSVLNYNLLQNCLHNNTIFEHITIVCHAWKFLVKSELIKTVLNHTKPL